MAPSNTQGVLHTHVEGYMEVEVNFRFSGCTNCETTRMNECGVLEESIVTKYTDILYRIYTQYTGSSIQDFSPHEHEV